MAFFVGMNTTINSSNSTTCNSIDRTAVTSRNSIRRSVLDAAWERRFQKVRGNLGKAIEGTLQLTTRIGKRDGIRKDEVHYLECAGWDNRDGGECC